MSRAEICVIGGGPAGSVCAARLARLGHNVVLLERSHFPRPHVGEGLSPGAWTLIDILGLRGALDAAGWLACGETELRWASCESERRTIVAPGIMIERGQFDLALLTAAANSGVRVRQPWQVRRVTRTTGDWMIEAESPTGSQIVSARFVIDASGRTGVLRGRRRRTAGRTIALYACWRGDRLPSVTRVLASERDWCWGALRPDGLYSAMVFADPSDLTDRVVSLSDRYRRHVLGVGLLDGSVGAEMIGAASACDATPYTDDESIGDGFIKAGEASFAIDPLSSTGVQKAVQSGLSASIAAHTMLVDGDAEAAKEFYAEDQLLSARKHAQWASDSYREAATRHANRFWQERAASPPSGTPAGLALGRELPPQMTWNTRIVPSPSLSRENVPCIVGDMVVRRPAVRTPALDRAVAFIAGADLPLLLDDLLPGMTLGALASLWSLKLSPARGLAVIQRCLEMGLLLPEAADLHSTR